MKSFAVILLLGVTLQVQGQDIMAVCRFFSDGNKRCQTQGCKSNSADLAKTREIPNQIGVDEAKDFNTARDPVLNYKCSGSAETSKWTQNDGFVFEKPSLSRGLPKYRGSCAFKNDAKKGWECRTCDNPDASGRCFVGGQDSYKPFYARGWEMKGKDFSTLTVTRD